MEFLDALAIRWDGVPENRQGSQCRVATVMAPSPSGWQGWAGIGARDFGSRREVSPIKDSVQTSHQSYRRTLTDTPESPEMQGVLCLAPESYRIDFAFRGFL